jgi:membrane associated rhomboid family serine protease
MYNQVTPVVRNLLIINIIIYIVNILTAEDINTLFGLHYIFSVNFAPWEFLTYMFMHSLNPMHLFSNMLGLFFFGPWLERVLGSQRFLTFYVITGMGAGLLQQGVFYYQDQQVMTEIEMEAETPKQATELYNQYNEQVVNNVNRVVVGESGAVFGVLIAFALIFPNIQMQLLFIPFGIKAKYLVTLFIIYELYSGVYYSDSSPVAHFAHLGGALIGFVLIKFWGIKREH